MCQQAVNDETDDIIERVLVGDLFTRPYLPNLA